MDFPSCSKVDACDFPHNCRSFLLQCSITDCAYPVRLRWRRWRGEGVEGEGGAKKEVKEKEAAKMRRGEGAATQNLTVFQTIWSLCRNNHRNQLLARYLRVSVHDYDFWILFAFQVLLLCRKKYRKEIVRRKSYGFFWCRARDTCRRYFHLHSFRPKLTFFKENQKNPKNQKHPKKKKNPKKKHKKNQNFVSSNASLLVLTRLPCLKAVG